MATTEKPIALQTDYQKSVASFESFLSPEEEQIEQAEEIIEDELIEEADEAEEIDELEEVDQEDLPEEEFEEQSEVEEVEQPQVYTVKVDGVEQEVTLEELQRGYSRQQDYTRKTQELSHERKTLEQQQAELAQRDAVYSQLLPKMEAQIMGDIENEPDWAKLSEEDPIAYVREKQVWDQKKEKLQAVQAEQQRLQQEAAVKQQEQVQQMIEFGQQKLLEIIPEWSDEKIANKEKSEIRNYAIETLGFSPQEMDQVYDYRALLGLRNAWLQGQTATAAKKKPTQKASVRAGKPGASTRKVSVAPEKKLRQRLAKSGKTTDAAKVFEQMLNK
jgi:hypothetical protein|tara:strand:+ start:826 stop:1818 length:993 start_codon:yes stop_codon:yes gene_type:complete